MQESSDIATRIKLPPVSGAYLEPFLGSGAVFFHTMRAQTHPIAARLGDTNRHLVRTFLAVRDSPEEVSARLETLQAEYEAAPDKRAFYYEARNAFNETSPRTDPGLFIFINRTCWNGLYRVNQMGVFNVPYGAPKTDRVVPSIEELLNASAALQRAELRVTAWQNTVALAQPGDFVFLDPPYYSEITGEDVRTKYQARPFTLRHHEELASALVDLDRRGVHFLLTNSGEDEMADLYSRHGLTVDLVEIPRPINSKADQRKAVRELVVTPRGEPSVMDLDAEVLLLPDS